MLSQSGDWHQVYEWADWMMMVVMSIGDDGNKLKIVRLGGNCSMEEFFYIIPAIFSI